MEPAKYDNRKQITHNGSPKYQNNAAGITTQTLFKGGGKRWQNIDGKFMRNRRSVWVVPTRPFKGAHFATFPPDLIRPCIMACCPENGVVLDPFIGAGTTALVARECGCNYIGIELNAEYVKIAENRLR